jgi:excinuclease ABC subunit C
MHKLGGFVTESDDFLLVNVPHNTNIVKLLQRIRDESHRFAVSYHTVLKRNRQTHSLIDEIPGVGPATKKKLLKEFGSLKGLKEAPHSDIAKVVGEQKANVIKQMLA